MSPTPFAALLAKGAVFVLIKGGKCGRITLQSSVALGYGKWVEKIVSQASSQRVNINEVYLAAVRDISIAADYYTARRRVL